MTKIAISPNPNGTGTFTIAAPNSNIDRTLTLPDAVGEVLTDARIASTLSARAGESQTELMTPFLAQQRVTAVSVIGGNEADLTTGYQTRLEMDFVPNTKTGLFVAHVRIDNVSGPSVDVLGNFQVFDTVTNAVAVSYETGETAPSGFGFAANFSVSLLFPNMTLGRLYKVQLQVRKGANVGPIFPRNMRIEGVTF